MTRPSRRYSMEIREIRSSDKAYFLASVKRFYGSTAVCHDIPEKNAERTFELLMKGTPYADCLIAEDENGERCGYCLLALTWSNEAGGMCVWIEEIQVDENHRNRGIGKALIIKVREKYAEAARFRLEITENNKRAAALYNKEGFSYLPYLQMLIDTAE